MALGRELDHLLLAVDPATGQVTVRRFTTTHDVGTIINPIGHQGQIEGGLIQGLGYALMEELPTEDGRISTLNLGEAKLPTVGDIPPLTTVLVEDAVGPGPFRAKAIGEGANLAINQAGRIEFAMHYRETLHDGASSEQPAKIRKDLARRVALACDMTERRADEATRDRILDSGLVPTIP